MGDSCLIWLLGPEVNNILSKHMLKFKLQILHMNTVRNVIKNKQPALGRHFMSFIPHVKYMWRIKIAFCLGATEK